MTADIAIVGAGILGLAHAYHAANAGLKVEVFERSAQAQGASVRNFGMVWPIGQPPGELRTIALRSRTHWLAALEGSGIWHRKAGSLTLAYAEDELTVLHEFASKASEHAYDCSVISRANAKALSPAIREAGLLGALHSPSEVCVFPRQVVAELPRYLESLDVKFHFGTAVTHAEDGLLVAGGKEVRAQKTIICSGDDFETLFPEHHSQSGMTRSKLQMLRMRPKTAGYSIGTHLCAGLTLGHYANFRICETLEPLLARYNLDYPEHVRWGIHLLVSQHGDGNLTVGDSHEYGLNVTPFLSEEIERLILGYLDTFLDTSELEVIERWHGVYAKHPTKAYVIDSPCENVTVVTGVGGAGMTLSFGLAEKVCSDLKIL